jgi:hypothetical protein
MIELFGAVTDAAAKARLPGTSTPTAKLDGP